MSFNVALNFEDGITRVITSNEGETVLDAAYRHQINLPMDCSDGVCGTCKGKCSQGQYDLGEEYIDDALTDEEASEGLILTCQMLPKSDVVISVPATSLMCKTGTTNVMGTVSRIDKLSATTFELEMTLSAPVGFLAGQYVNLNVPGINKTRAYSFSSLPGDTTATFLIRNMPGGLMSNYLSNQANKGDQIEVTGPIGSFYLRAPVNPIVMLAGGTGLAPLLSMLEQLKKNPTDQKIHMLYGVTNMQDLVKLDALKVFSEEMDNFTYDTVVVNAECAEQRKGFVTNHMDAISFDIESADVYLCGPPPMVDAVMNFLTTENIKPLSFHYEKFNPTSTKDGV
ncbi:benzoate 1,2-dioxygenase electron transfer component [Pseudoalteromonas sp. BSi20311]|jgi:benzoate/toluate 1,2-dioxygenase reductase subunit|uniref:benzoate 1,2-dioxygenase electron transfer component BenC n=1 Tax=Pseudoalteromonas sp. BSi20311 TaxID=383911 RepID=UPI0002318C3E|nr:benzoate 1,2-dioxygenase electron transfer component BenC [Pseudoalteromonas sp. BSi20311]MAD76823.1 NADH oxidase [Rheinheimera sp.]GAA62433.1 benzoate 1,2-dioxygenase electron transfer component [Pseudoalteromonas sp. BSi20311]HCP98927.1 NADH oxidase [Pseudoalteromonas sp.]|tara:strand:+ start:2529 stop:3548 length:1020 start_codon:yes stop_codon:yes gene_type:complete